MTGVQTCALPICISSFIETTGDDFKEALKDIEGKSAKGLGYKIGGSND